MAVSGHVSFTWEPHVDSINMNENAKWIASSQVYLVESNSVEEDDIKARANLYLKLHRHLGHASAANLERIRKNAGKKRLLPRR